MKKIIKFDYAISDTHFGHYNVNNYSNRPFVYKVERGCIYFEDKLVKVMVSEQDAIVEAKRLSVELMNNTIMKNWNEKVKKEDVVLFGGDFAFLDQEKIKVLLSQLNGYKILIRGNHDHKEKAMLDCGFNEVMESAIVEIDGTEVLLSHYPYINPQFNNMAKERPNIIKFIKVEKNHITCPETYDYNEARDFLLSNKKLVVNKNIAGGTELFNYMKRAISAHIGTRLVNEGKILIHGHTHLPAKRFANMINISCEAWGFSPASFSEIEELVKEIKEEQKLINITKETHTSEVYEYYSKIKEFKDIKELVELFKMEHGAKCLNIPSNYSKQWYETSVALGHFIPKNKLKDKTLYTGNCRNSETAYWQAEKGCFTYLRTKFSDKFLEDINTVENDDGYDLFIPHTELKREENEEEYSIIEKLL